MHYTIFNSTGNLVESFTTEADALNALNSMVVAEPAAAEELAILTFDEHGRPVGEAIFASNDEINTPLNRAR